jgi:TRAP-type mannitol/chloroaromatic compound transport system substrate-binding protein
MDANMLLAWHKWGGGKELLEKIYASIGANVVSFPYAPLYTQPLGWFKKVVTKADDFKGLKYRTVGISIDLFTAMGAAVNALPGGEIVPAIDRGLLDAAEFNNTSSDRALGFADVSKICMLQSYHQKAIIASAVDAASANMMWKAIDRNSQDYITLQAVDKVKFYKTPASILQKQLELYDQVVAKKSEGNAMFTEIVASQKKFAERAVKWEQDVVVSRTMAYNHYFGKAAGKKA